MVASGRACRLALGHPVLALLVELPVRGSLRSHTRVTQNELPPASGVEEI
jgi:hypothetical protein